MKNPLKNALKLSRQDKLIIALYIIAFAMLGYLQVIVNASGNSGVSRYSGVVAQLQVMISVYLGGRYYKSGYMTSMVMNGIYFLFMAVQFLILQRYAMLPGLVVTLCTMIINIIISYFGRRINDNIKIVSEKNEQLEFALKDVSAKNEQLIQSNKLIREKEDELSYLAYYDVLTELPNRRKLINSLNFYISFCEKKNSKLTVVFIDLDNFKSINDTMGHQTGDRLLQDISNIIKDSMDSQDMVGRIGGDEFALIIQRDISSEELEEYINKIKDAFAAIDTVENNAYCVHASFGSSVYPDDGKTSSELFKFADLALHKAKEKGKNQWISYTDDMQEEILEHMTFESKLTEALQNQEFFLVFQPQYAAFDKKLRGFETLVRWNSPDMGFVSPAKFIPVAEDIGMIQELGKWILIEACNKLKSVQDKYGTDIILSINISSIQLMTPGFLKMVNYVFYTTGINPYQIEFEITESVFISSMDKAISILNEIKKLGIKIALDDFGTGYSSLNYLYRLPIDTLKIDKSFIDTLLNEEDKRNIVGSIISMSHVMGLEVIAEGVEEAPQLEYLNKHRCDFIQGYIWGKPIVESEFRKIICDNSQAELVGNY